MENLKFTWLQDGADVARLVELFIKAANASYISHSEIYEGRAVSPNEWADNLAEVLTQEFQSAQIEGDQPAFVDTFTAVLLMRAEGEIIGFATLSFILRRRLRLCILADIIVDTQNQSSGLGGLLLSQVETICKDNRITQLHLESGLHNEKAHSFFVKRGFHPLSKTFMKEI